MHLPSVLLPLPDSPTSPTHSPSLTPRLTSSTATTLTLDTLKHTSTDRELLAHPIDSHEVPHWLSFAISRSWCKKHRVMRSASNGNSLGPVVQQISMTSTQRG